MGVVKADRLKDMTSIAGVRSNQLVGYGLVVGLAGTGDGNAVLTQQAMQSMISQFGVVTNASRASRCRAPRRTVRSSCSD